MYYTNKVKEYLESSIEVIESEITRARLDYPMFKLDEDYEEGDINSLFFEQVYYIENYLKEYLPSNVERVMLDILYRATTKEIIGHNLEDGKCRIFYEDAEELGDVLIQDLIYDAIYQHEVEEEWMNRIKKAEQRVREIFNIHDDEEVHLCFNCTNSTVELNGMQVSKEIAEELYSIYNN